MITRAVTCKCDAPGRESHPGTRLPRFVDDVRRTAACALAIAVIEHGVNEPAVVRSFNLTAIGCDQIRPQRIREANTELRFGRGNTRFGRRKSHDAPGLQLAAGVAPVSWRSRKYRNKGSPQLTPIRQVAATGSHSMRILRAVPSWKMKTNKTRAETMASKPKNALTRPRNNSVKSSRTFRPCAASHGTNCEYGSKVPRTARKRYSQRMKTPQREMNGSLTLRGGTSLTDPGETKRGSSATTTQLPPAYMSSGTRP